MKVYELMNVLAKCDSGSDVVVSIKGVENVDQGGYYIDCVERASPEWVIIRGGNDAKEGDEDGDV